MILMRPIYLSLLFTIGASTSKFVGRALNLRSPGDLAGRTGKDLGPFGIK